MSKLKEIKIKEGMPSVQEARQNLIQIIQNSRNEGKRFLKIIHGYGSTGIGGKLREALRTSLINFKKNGVVKHIIFGERFHRVNSDLDKILKEYPFLRDDADYNQNNEGVTIVILKRM